ncbi:hypothetical protein [Brachyspira sp.]|nr:hypothetical protein [Brachyspira sp.]
MPLALQIHHIVYNGYHIGIFFYDLKKEFYEFNSLS